MQIRIAARHGQLSDETRAKIEGKVEKLSRLFERLTSIEVTIDLEHKDTPRVDIQVSAEHKHDFVASDTSSELWASLDKVVHKIEQQLRKYKEKIQDHHRTDKGRQVAAQTEPDSDEE